MPVGAKIIGSAIYPDGHFGQSKVVRDAEDLKNVKLLILHGGEDISPSIYGEVPVHTHASAKPSIRDEVEMLLVDEAVKAGIPILGICRGAQLLCAMHGGKLYQHVNGHAGHSHSIKVGSNIIFTNSAHHQMMIPDKDAEILASTEKALSPTKFREHPHPITANEPEPEIVWFPKFRALGVQGHPEWLPEHAPLNKLTSHLLREMVKVELFE